jgi:hypothetical protein
VQHLSKILPPLWGLLGAAWRLAPSHQLVRALDPPAVTSVNAPNTRSLIFAHHGGVGPGAGAPRSGPGLAEKGWGPRWLGFESVLGGAPVGSTGGGRGSLQRRRFGNVAKSNRGRSPCHRCTRYKIFLEQLPASTALHLSRPPPVSY